MSLRERSATDRVLADRERYVAAGVSTPPLVVSRAEGAHIWDLDGHEYIDFAGGLGCQNAGHGLPAAVAAIHEQVDHYLHQCFMVAIYEPYLEVCRRLAELSPCAGADQKSILVNSGAEAVENAVKIARAATGRPGVLVFAQDVDPGRVACVVLEPVQGEGGFIPMPEDFPRRLKDICERHGILFVD